MFKLKPEKVPTIKNVNVKIALMISVLAIIIRSVIANQSPIVVVVTTKFKFK